MSGNPQRGRGQNRGGTGGPRGRGRGDSPQGRGGSPAASEASGHDSRGRGGGQGGRGFDSRGRGGGGGGGGPGGGAGGFRGGAGGGGGGGGGGGFRGGGPPGRGRGGGPVIFAEHTPAQLPPRLTDTSLNQVITAFKAVKLKPERPLRPGFGTAGTAITLRANFFPVKVPKGPIFDYVVEIAPKTDINRLKTRIFQILEIAPEFQKFLPFVAHDRSARLVAARALPQPLDIRIPFFDDHEKGPSPNAKVYIMSIKFERNLDTSQLTQYMDGNLQSRDYDPLPLISALNLVLQTYPNRNGIRVGQNRFFFPQGQRASLGPGVIALQGFYTSVRPAYKQLMVNVNFCMTAFVEPGNVADSLLAFSRNSRGGLPNLPKSLAKSMKVRTKHLGYKKPLKSIASTHARNTFFDCEEFGGKISVEEYFLKKYKIKLKHPTDLPVIDIGGAKRANYVPAELCDIEDGNPYRGKLSDRETAQMIRYACNPPRVNAESIINEGFPALGVSPPQQPLDNFGVAIDTEMAVVPARELRPPRLSYKVGQANVRDGSWNILDVKFHRGATIATWWVLVVRDGQNTIQRPDDPVFQTLVNGFRNKLARSGIAVPEGLPRVLPPATLGFDPRDPTRLQAIDTIRQTLKKALAATKKPSFVLVLLENRDNYIYPGIKRIGDVELGIPTVHMQLGKAIGDPKKQDQYFSNVALKVNTKLGGINHLLEESAMKWLTKKKTMMVGIDVTHPGPGSREGTPSIAAVVASVDDSFVQFPASLRVQESKKEMLDELQEMIVERLLVYERKNKALPSRILVYRDGVSEGQFDTVLETELAQILEAFKKMNTTGRKEAYRPSISIIICGKRHHARFFPTNSQNADRNGNTRPGTVVDKGVTGVFDFDFYLQAHAGLQGSVKATHYTVVYDENGLTADEVQQGTHDVSYLYARATKAVSLIPAAYYADLACERGRCYLNEFLVDDKTSTSGINKFDRDAESKRVFAAAKTSWGQGLHADTKETMFYI